MLFLVYTFHFNNKYIFNNNLFKLKDSRFSAGKQNGNDFSRPETAFGGGEQFIGFCA